MVNLHQLKEEPKGKNTISFKYECGNITRPYLITIDSTKQMWLHSNMYFQINESIPETYLLYITPPWNHSIVEPKSILHDLI
jgi:hypothetical protein